MKEEGINHWNSPNTGATNESGFTALPGGYRSYYYDYFDEIGRYGCWWSSTQYSTNNAWYRNLLSNISDFNRYCGQPTKESGYSVRCLRD